MNRAALDDLPLDRVLPLLAEAGYDAFGSPHLPRILCPFHSERTPSCQLYYAPWAHFWCYACGAHGDLVVLLARALYPDEHPGWAWAYAWKRLWNGEAPVLAPHGPVVRREAQALDDGERGALGTALAFYQESLWGADPAGRDYLRARFPKDGRALDRVLHEDGVGYATRGVYQRIREALQDYPDMPAWLVRTGVAYQDPEEGLVPRLTQRVVLAERRARGSLYYQARDARPPGERTRQGGRTRAPYLSPPLPKHGIGVGHALAHPVLPVLLVEGPVDQLAARLCGYAAVATLGSTPPPGLTDVLAGRDVVDALDADAGGQTIRKAIGPCLARARSVRRIALPRGLDPAEVVRRGGAIALQRLVE